MPNETDVTYNQSLEQVIPTLARILQEMRDAPDRAELTDIDSDTAFELGYETALHDLKRYTGDDPAESGVIVYFKKEENDDEH